MNASIKLAQDFFKQTPLGVLATLNDLGLPETAAVYCAPDDDLNLYFLSASKTRKLDNIEARPAVSITFVAESAMRTMQVQGEAKVIATPLEVIYFEAVPKVAADALLNLHLKREQLTPAFKTGGNFQYVVKIVPTWMRLADFTQAAEDQSRIYTTIVEPKVER